MTETLTKYDPDEDLASPNAMATFMTEALATNDANYVAHAFGLLFCAKGTAQIAAQTGFSRERLHRSFSAKGNPTLRTVLAVTRALGLQLTVRRHSQLQD